jgi:hypothetical protein
MRRSLEQLMRAQCEATYHTRPTNTLADLCRRMSWRMCAHAQTLKRIYMCEWQPSVERIIATPPRVMSPTDNDNEADAKHRAWVPLHTSVSHRVLWRDIQNWLVDVALCASRAAATRSHFHAQVGMDVCVSRWKSKNLSRRAIARNACESNAVPTYSMSINNTHADNHCTQ